MIEYKYNKKDNKFTENGHTMFEVDVLQRLKRLAYVEEQIKKGQLMPITSKPKPNDYYESEIEANRQSTRSKGLTWKQEYERDLNRWNDINCH